MIRAGKDPCDAFDYYCQLGLVKPTYLLFYTGQDRSLGDLPNIFPALYQLDDDIKAGSSDADAQNRFLTKMRECLVMFRPMEPHEKWNAHQLYKRMSQAEKDKVLELFGVTKTAHIMLGY